MAPLSSVISSSRTLLLGKGTTFADLRKKRRTINKRSLRLQRVQTAKTTIPDTQEQLACIFVELVKNESDNQDAYQELALQITLLRRNLHFSSRNFVNLWLQELQQDGVRALVSYHYLVSAVKCPSTLSLTTIVERADRRWLSERIQQLIKEDYHAALSQDYMEAIVDVSCGENDLSMIMDLCNQKHSDMLSDNSACLQLLQVLQDPNRLKMLSPKERQNIVMQVIFNPLVQTESERKNLSVQDILSAKSNALLKAQAMLDSPMLQLLVFWFGECNHLTRPASSWPFLYTITLDKLAFAEESADVQFDIQLLLCLYAVACQQLAQNGDQGFAAVVELLAALNQRLADEIAAGLRPIQFAAIVSFVQILLHHTKSIVGIPFHQWFQETFADPATTKLHGKRVIHRFINELEKAVNFEMPAVLQIQAKVLQKCTIINSNKYIALVKTRLRKLGLDFSLRSIPQTLTVPEQVTGQTGSQSVEDYVRDAVAHYSRRGTIPQQLLKDAIFRAVYFRSTILPAFLAWQPSSEDSALKAARDELFKLLRDRKKVPDDIYNEFLRQQRR